MRGSISLRQKLLVASICAALMGTAASRESQAAVHADLMISSATMDVLPNQIKVTQDGGFMTLEVDGILSAFVSVTSFLIDVDTSAGTGVLQFVGETWPVTASVPLVSGNLLNSASLLSFEVPDSLDPNARFMFQLAGGSALGELFTEQVTVEFNLGAFTGNGTYTGFEGDLASVVPEATSLSVWAGMLALGSLVAVKQRRRARLKR